MKSKLLLFSVLHFVLLSSAQDSNFHLKDYKYRTPGFKALSVGINLGGSLNHATTSNINERKTRSFYLLPSLINYQRSISTDKRIHTSSFGLYPSVQSQYLESQKSVSKSHELRYSFDWTRNDRFYKKSNWFLEAGNKLSNQFTTSKQKDSIFKTGQNNFTLENTLSLGFGKGRIEQVQDAQMALFILKDLQDQGLLNTAISPEIAGDFAQLITSINNKRVFDNRRRRIYELTQIDSFLRSSGLVTTTDIRHFTTINDNWALAFNPARLSGASWFVRLQPSIGYLKTRSMYDKPLPGSFSTEQNQLGLSPVIGYENFIPVNLNWQQNMGISART